MIIIAKEYRPDGRGRWLYRGYVTAGGKMIGRWRDTFTPDNMSGYEGWVLKDFSTFDSWHLLIDKLFAFFSTFPDVSCFTEEMLEGHVFCFVSCSPYPFSLFYSLSTVLAASTLSRIVSHCHFRNNRSGIPPFRERKSEERARTEGRHRRFSRVCQLRNFHHSSLYAHFGNNLRSARPNHRKACGKGKSTRSLVYDQSHRTKSPKDSGRSRVRKSKV